MRLLCLSLVLLLMALSAACSERSAEAESLLYGFELNEFEGIPATDIAFQIEPSVVAQKDLAQPSSQLMADALRTCREQARAPGVLDTPQGVELMLRGSKLTRVAASTQKPSPLSACLAAALDGRSFNALDGADHKVTIQVRRHFELP